MSKDDSEGQAREAPRVRQCLKCRSEFLSAWDGHRICDRCKHSSTWREGMSAQAYGAGGHR